MLKKPSALKLRNVGEKGTDSIVMWSDFNGEFTEWPLGTRRGAKCHAWILVLIFPTREARHYDYLQFCRHMSWNPNPNRSA